jgi:hypothetical protein
MSVLDPNLKYLLKKTDPYQYYMFGEVSQISECQGTINSMIKLCKVFKRSLDWQRSTLFNLH